MGRVKTLLCIIVILVFGMVSTAMASTFLFQPEPTTVSAFDGNGTINWSGLFASIDHYKPASHRAFYTHGADATPGGTFSGGESAGGVFVGQGLSLDFGAGRHLNEKVAAVVAALAGCVGTDHLDFGSNLDQYRSFSALGATYSPVSTVPLPGSLWFLFSGFGTLLATRRWWRK